MARKNKKFGEGNSHFGDDFIKWCERPKVSSFKIIEAIDKSFYGDDVIEVHWKYLNTMLFFIMNVCSGKVEEISLSEVNGYYCILCEVDDDIWTKWVKYCRNNPLSGFFIEDK